MTALISDVIGAVDKYLPFKGYRTFIGAAALIAHGAATIYLTKQADRQSVDEIMAGLVAITAALHQTPTPPTPPPTTPLPSAP